MASTAKKIFDDIFDSASPEGAITKLVLSEKLPECEYVEYKCPPDLEDEPSGATKARDKRQQLQDAKENWSKALSAFANTAGGLLIWGVKCSRNSDGIDEPSGFDFVTNGTRLRDKLVAQHTQANSDFVEGVDIRVVNFKAGGSVVVCYIPEGSNKPYRADYASKAYFIRMQSNSLVMPHSMLRSLFYPRSSPKFQLELTASIRHEGQGHHVDFSVQLQNTGTATADEVIVRVILRYPDPARLNLISNTWAGNMAKEGFQDIAVLSAKKSIHPFLPLDVFSFTTRKYDYFDMTRKFAFDFDIYGRNQDVTRLGVEFHLGEIQTAPSKKFKVTPRKDGENQH
jgi:Putative DNA-binding domain